MNEISILDICGVKVGHAQDERAATGCTVLLFPGLCPAGCDIRGGGPASRETSLTDPRMASQGLNGVLLSGGSAFGLDAAGGVLRYLEERGIGFDVGVTKVPLVCESCVFDLAVGDFRVRPDQAMAYAACQDAERNVLREGNVGVGTGCTVGKLLGAPYAMKSGVGVYAVQVGKIQVGAVVAVNALGDVYDIDTGAPLAGLLEEDGASLRSTEQTCYASIERPVENAFVGNTTIGCIVTNGGFSKAEMNKLAAMASNGYARTIRPVNTTADGDSLYAVSVGQEPAALDVVGTLAAYVTGKAVNRAVLTAKGAYGLKAACDLPR
ncbi:MAG: P1 family peptidase [Clostridiales bacterium]|nr:P1 family peptidase [Clostridiales bacterium]